MKNSNLSFFNTTIYPGETTSLALPFPALYSCASFHLPIKVIHGKQAGPCVLVCAAMHGDELNGLEIINRLLRSKALKRLKGTLIAIPVLNVMGLVGKPRAFAQDISLEQCFPGKPHGSYGERIAHFITQEILCKADYCIELQTGALNHDILPQVYCNLDNPDSRQLARQFSVPVVTHLKRKDNSFHKTAEDMNIPMIMYRAGEAMRLDESSIHQGLTGIQNVMAHLDMLHQGYTPALSEQPSIFSQDQDWMRAHHSGVLRSDIVLGQTIKRRQRLGLIIDPFSADTIEPVKSPRTGVVVGINRHPLIHEGQSLFKIASFIDNHKASNTLEAWNDSQVNT